MKAAKLETRSPLKDKPLRNPGQSVQEAIDKVMEDEVEYYLLPCAITVSMFGAALMQWLFKTPLYMMLIISSSFMVGAFAVFFLKFRVARKKIKQLKQARDGEIAVAECLDLLREQECRVFHDIIGENFNIDHVIVAPQGIFTIETKRR